jgi:hypothetical protein
MACAARQALPALVEVPRRREPRPPAEPVIIGLIDTTAVALSGRGGHNSVQDTASYLLEACHLKDFLESNAGRLIFVVTSPR